MHFLLKMGIFYCYVSLPEGKLLKGHVFFLCGYLVMYNIIYTYMGSSMIYIYGCTSKFEVRTNPQNPPAIQTPDPDLRSRPIQTSRSRPMIQTSCFILFGFVDPDPLFYFGVNMLDPAPSLPLWLDCGLEGHAVQLLAAASLLLAAAQLEHFGSKSAYPVPDLVPHRSRPVPDRSRSFPDRSMESNLMEEEFSGQCKII